MSRPRGRPPKPTVDTIDPVIMDMARDLLAEAARSRRGFRTAPAGEFRPALLALRLSEAFDALATESVRQVRTEDESVTWADVGRRFDTSSEAARMRFG